MISAVNNADAIENKPKLCIRNLSKIYDNKKVLDEISFDVREGEFLSILGPSGCGKTTLLRIIIGLLQPSAGQVIKDDKDITYASPASRRMGIVFQNYALFENMTVLGNVEYALKVKRETKHEAKEKALQMIELVGLSEHMHKKPDSLSGGQQQRVAIARTLVLKPDIILFDEPMSSLDISTRLSLRKMIKRIQREFRTTIIYVTHDQEEAFSMSDRIMVMEEAHLTQIDMPENIIAHPANAYVRSFVLDNLKEKISSLAKYAGY